MDGSLDDISHTQSIPENNIIISSEESLVKPIARDTQWRIVDLFVIKLSTACALIQAICHTHAQRDAPYLSPDTTNMGKSIREWDVKVKLSSKILQIHVGKIVLQIIPRQIVVPEGIRS